MKKRTSLVKVENIEDGDFREIPEEETPLEDMFMFLLISAATLATIIDIFSKISQGEVYGKKKPSKDSRRYNNKSTNRMR
jgi:hypothetical protein